MAVAQIDLPMAGSEARKAEARTRTVSRDSLLSEAASQRGAVNCHMTVNQAALSALVRPLLSELVAERMFEERFMAMEKMLHRLESQLELRATADGLAALDLELKRQRQQLALCQQLPDGLKAQLKSLEESLAYKVGQSALTELKSSLDKVENLVAQKADVSAMNKLSATLNRVAQLSSESERRLQDLAISLKALEQHHLPVTVQRVREQVGKNTSAIKQLQETIVSKADHRELEAAIASHHVLASVVAKKGEAKAVAEVAQSVKDAQRMIDTKLDQSCLEGTKAEVRKIHLELLQKANEQELRESLAAQGAGLKTLRLELNSKATVQALGDFQHRLEAFEATLNQKLEHQDLPNLEPILDSLSQKAERSALSEISTAVGRLTQELGQKMDMEASHEHSRELEQMRSQLQQARLADREALDSSFYCLKSKIEALEEKLKVGDGPPVPLEASSEEGPEEEHPERDAAGPLPPPVLLSDSLGEKAPMPISPVSTEAEEQGVSLGESTPGKALSSPSPVSKFSARSPPGKTTYNKSAEIPRRRLLSAYPFAKGT